MRSHTMYAILAVLSAALVCFVGSCSPRTTAQNEDVSDESADELLIVSLGDSYASGEGNPPFNDAKCHRSDQAAPSLAVQKLKAAYPDKSIEFIHLACAGAGSIRGMLQPCRGSTELPCADSRGNSGFVAPQIDELARQLCSVDLGSDENGLITEEKCPDGKGRQIDILIISAGGNDIGFADILIACAVFEDCYKTETRDIYPGDINDMIRTIRNVDQRIEDLDEKYDRLDRAIRSKINPPPLRIYLTEYPDPSRDHDLSWCHAVRNAKDLAEHESGFFHDVAINVADLMEMLQVGDADFEGITSDESWFAYSNVLRPLNRKLFDITEDLDWNYVGGIMASSRGHGSCADDRWFRRGTESIQLQGDVFGLMHPNQQGHDNISDQIVEFIVNDPQPTFDVYPLFDAEEPNLYVNQTNANGITSGVCIYHDSDPGTPIDCTSNMAYLTIVASNPYGLDAASISINGEGAQYRDFAHIEDEESQSGGPHDLNGEYDCTSIERREVIEVDIDGRVEEVSRLVDVVDIQEGVVCNHSVDSRFERSWFIKFTQSGTYNFRFELVDSLGNGQRIPYDIEVALEPEEEFRIKDVTLTADPNDYRGICPHTINFLGTITTEGGTGSVVYRFLRSNGTKTAAKSVTLFGAGTHEISSSWHTGQSVQQVQNFEGWGAIEILEPQTVESNRAHFSMTCEPPDFNLEIECPDEGICP